MNSHLILTVDYEVFGNGQGCLKHCVVEPARRLLQLADQFDAPVTLFVEAAEFMAMERELGRHAVQDVREQLATAVSGGHDVQLHLHPQWQGAKKRHDGGWELDLDRWRIGDLHENEIDDLIAVSRAWLDDVAFAAGMPGRRCVAFRAGNWCIQPSAAVVRSLRRQGFRVESTVVPGMRRADRGQWSDFRSAPDLPFWRVESDVCKAGASGLWEVPIASARVSRLEQLAAELQARGTANSRFAPNCSGSYATRSTGLDRVTTNVRKLLDLGLAKLDFSTMPAQTLVTITRDWLNRFQDAPRPTPIVAIAHTKNWTDRSATHLAEYLTWARGAGIRFSTYPEWLSSVEPATAPVARAV